MAEVIARVIEQNGKVEGGFVELSNGETTVSGRVAAVSNNEFLVDWEDGARTVENQSDYELVVESRTAAENPAQPAGWAVPPVDADAHPGGELIAIEMEKRNDTAAWEDAQNRPPMDGENPAQPAGFAVPPATGGPIPGQGADGLMMAARVVADDITGENGLVEITNGNLRVAGKVLASDDDSFIVEWEDERRTVESKADYDLVIEAGMGQRIKDWFDPTKGKEGQYPRLRELGIALLPGDKDPNHELLTGRTGGAACGNCGGTTYDVTHSPLPRQFDATDEKFPGQRGMFPAYEQHNCSSCGTEFQGNPFAK